MSFTQWLLYLFRLIFLPRARGTLEWKMLRLVNRDRKDHGLKGLKMQSDLRSVARKHSKDMAQKDYFAHENLQGESHVDRLSKAKVTDRSSGENLAKIRGFLNPVHRAEQGLMKSPGHRANLLNGAYNCIGIGLHRAQDKTLYFTQLFAVRHVIFENKVPKRIKVGKNLKLKLSPLGRFEKIVIQVENGTKTLYEKHHSLQQKNTLIQVPMDQKGWLEVKIYSQREDGHYQLSNHFQVHATKSWLF